jgi:glucokinase
MRATTPSESPPVTVEAIGVDLGGTKMLVGVVDAERNSSYRATAPSIGLGQEELISTLERELEAAVEARPDAAAIGLGIPCTIDRERGVAVSAVNLELADVPIRDLVSRRLGLPAVVDNDVNAAILAEHRFGAARGAENAVMLTIGTGIGGGLVIGGEVYRGSSGAGAELGHVVIEADGPRCQGNCPNRG